MTPEQMKGLLEQMGIVMGDSEDSTEDYARMAAENIKFILQKDQREILEGATHKVNNYRALIGSLVTEEMSLTSHPSLSTGESLLMHLCYSVMRELKDVIVWAAFHQEDKDFRDWILREVFDVDIRVQEEVLDNSMEFSEDDDSEESNNDNEEL